MCGRGCSDLADFWRVAGGSRKLLPLLRGCPIEPGVNNAHVILEGEVLPESGLPPNYIGLGRREFHLVIADPDTVSQ
jgi:hypothetical protein